MPFLTPDAPSLTRAWRITVPDTFLPVVRGSLAEMLGVCDWEAFGALTVDQAVEYASQIFDSFLEVTTTMEGAELLQGDDDEMLQDDNGEIIFES